MAAKRTMLWLLVWRALRLRFQRVSVVFAALMVGATIVTALFAVWFDINTKMSEELRTFGWARAPFPRVNAYWLPFRSPVTRAFGGNPPPSMA